MENKKRKSSHSLLHRSLRKKMRNTTCPGCQNSYALKSFKEHKSSNYDDENEVWRCSSNRCNYNTSNNELTNPTSGSELDNNPVSLQEELRKQVKLHLKRSLTKADMCIVDEESDTDETDTEIWNNVTIEDVDDDIGSKKTQNDVTNVSTPFTLVMWLCIFICTFQVTFMLPDNAITELLSFLHCFFRAVSDTSPILAAISVVFPPSLYMLWKTLGINVDNFTKYVVCRKCYSLYSYEDCIVITEGKRMSRTCTFVPYPNHTQRAKRRCCGEKLLRSIKVGKKETLYPFKTYSYKSVTETIQRFLKKKTFEENCERWRKREHSETYSDVYDGNVWKEFMTDEKSNFLVEKHNYALMLNLDWFQPFKHVQYSVGVIYAVVLNLPRNERFKLNNVILIGVIPAMKKEPPVSTFLKPFVDELNIAWNEGVFATTYQHPSVPIRIKLAILCVGCDIPATRKLCGFLGHAASLGCSKCFKNFPGNVGEKDYSGFDTESWPKRSMEGHRTLLRKLETAKTQTEKEKLESRLGVRYSCLETLPYFNIVRYATIDPMHNMYQGTAKHMLKLWIRSGVIDDKKFEIIQEKVDNVDAASSIGRQPRKIASSFGGFTAEQWMIWTNLFSVYALKGILAEQYLNNWRYFVTASRILASKYITANDIACFHDNIMMFCRGVEALFGKNVITPNMHLHGHLSGCMSDFGPVHSFWLFSFERYNGHLGNMPNNHRAVEIQFMRRFQRDALVKSIPVPQKFQVVFSSCADFLHASTEDNSETVHQHYHELMKLAEPTTTIADQKWNMTEQFQLHGISISTLESDEVVVLQKTYQVLYPNIDISACSIPHSCRKVSHVSCGHEVIGSFQSRHKRSSFIMANWNAGDGRVVTDIGLDVTPGVVQTFVLHNIMVNSENNLHLFAVVQWCARKPSLRNASGYPVEIWSNKLIEPFGAASFIPVQRILRKAVFAHGFLRNQAVLYVIPLGRRLEF